MKNTDLIPWDRVRASICACEGVELEDLEPKMVAKLLAAREKLDRNLYRRQRNALLDELEQLVAWMEQGDAEPSFLAGARRAIAFAKGKTVVVFDEIRIPGGAS